MIEKNLSPARFAEIRILCIGVIQRMGKPILQIVGRFFVTTLTVVAEQREAIRKAKRKPL